MASESKRSTDDEAGWEDWDEDQRRALGRSHKRTIGSLEERSSVSRSKSKSPTPAPTTILPTDRELATEATLSKQRKTLGEETIERRYRFVSKRCILVNAVAVTCFVGLAVVVFLMPEGGPHLPHAGEGVIVQPYSATDDQNDSKRKMFLRKAASFFGRKHGKEDDRTTPFPDYAIPGVTDKWKPPNYDGLYSGVNTPLTATQAVLWFTSRSGTRTVMDVMSYCGKLVLSSDAAAGHELDTTLQVFSTPDNIGHFSNVNTMTVQGIQQAQQLGLVDSQLVNVLVTRDLSSTSRLFQDRRRTGRLFAIFRDPIEKALSDYHYRKGLPTEDPNRLPEELSISQYVESAHVNPNAIVKGLVNLTDDTVVNAQHVLAAQQLVQDKILVGLVERFEESVTRFMEYFGWQFHDAVCIANFVAARDHRTDHGSLKDKSEEYKTLADRNWGDVEVYKTIQSTFDKQRRTVKTVSG